MSYPLLNIFWTMFEFFVWVAWLWVLICVIMEIFRSRDLSGGAKAGWFAFVFFIPLIGLLVYLIARGGKMHERAEVRAARDYEYRRSYTSGGPARVTAAPLPIRSSRPRRRRSWLEHCRLTRDPAADDHSPG